MVHIYVGVHEVGTELCRPDLHCFSCQRDEDGPAYLACGECRHLYRTARDLRRAERAFGTQGLRVFWPDAGWRRNAQWFPSYFDLIRSWVRSRFVRARRVYSCPFCGHDF